MLTHREIRVALWCAYKVAMIKWPGVQGDRPWPMTGMDMGELKEFAQRCENILADHEAELDEAARRAIEGQ